ncbi:hypothetical protein TCAL_15574 [Tigriopus californicus]|uniref:Protein sleepless n=2 Tax=Tigriopus californicus TaxID=6832 RepID=A0A553PAT6_TIGCA|nr:hypothetical protein TCAL_15574 [Tigriopus californicus]
MDLIRSLKQTMRIPKHSVCYAIVSIFVILAMSLPEADALKCYSGVSGSISEDCLSNTGCMKRFDQKTQQTLDRSCFTPPVPPTNSTCTTDPNGFGICYCFTDLCNAAPTTRPILNWTNGLAVTCLLVVSQMVVVVQALIA